VKTLEATLSDPGVFKDRPTEVQALIAELDAACAEVERLFARGRSSTRSSKPARAEAFGASAARRWRATMVCHREDGTDRYRTGRVSPHRRDHDGRGATLRCRPGDRSGFR